MEHAVSLNEGIKSGEKYFVSLEYLGSKWKLIPVKPCLIGRDWLMRPMKPSYISLRLARAGKGVHMEQRANKPIKSLCLNPIAHLPQRSQDTKA